MSISKDSAPLQKNLKTTEANLITANCDQGKVKLPRNTQKTSQKIFAGPFKKQEPSKNYFKNKLKSSNNEVDELHQKLYEEIKEIKQLQVETRNLKYKLSSFESTIRKQINK